jgi:hypothetical protein
MPATRQDFGASTSAINRVLAATRIDCAGADRYVEPDVQPPDFAKDPTAVVFDIYGNIVK